MDKLPNSIHEITKYHDYKVGLKTSDWSLGLNEKGKIGGSILDKLRNAVPNDDWIQLITVVKNNERHLPSKQYNEWNQALLKLSNLLDINNPKGLHYSGEFSDYISDKNSNSKLKSQLQKCLWQMMASGAECLIFCNYEIED